MKKGFTLIEILIVIAIIGILTTISVSVFSTYRSVQSIDRDTDTVVEILRQARSETLSSENATTYGVHFASSTITLFAGSSYSGSNSTNQNFPLVSADTVLTVSLTGGGYDVVFNRLSGETNENGTIVLSSKTINRTHTITMYKTGLIDFQ